MHMCACFPQTKENPLSAATAVAAGNNDWREGGREGGEGRGGEGRGEEGRGTR